MAIFGIGTDIIEVGRIKKLLEKNNGFKEKIFTSNEIVYCEKFILKEQNYAARYAAKEALFKALGTGWRYGMAFNEIEILNDDLGKPSFVFLGKVMEYIANKKVKTTHLSMSHIKEFASAFVTLET